MRPLLMTGKRDVMSCKAVEDRLGNIIRTEASITRRTVDSDQLRTWSANKIALIISCADTNLLWLCDLCLIRKDSAAWRTNLTQSANCMRSLSASNPSSPPA
eukprot:11366206-Alexandrium_andersonii.AAC.1